MLFVEIIDQKNRAGVDRSPRRQCPVKKIVSNHIPLNKYFYSDFRLRHCNLWVCLPPAQAGRGREREWIIILYFSRSSRKVWQNWLHRNKWKYVKRFWLFLFYILYIVGLPAPRDVGRSAICCRLEVKKTFLLWIIGNCFVSKLDHWNLYYMSGRRSGDTKPIKPELVGSSSRLGSRWHWQQ